MNSTLVLSSAYFPNIEYFSKLIAFNPIFIEAKSHYLKQTLSNRCEIMAANGILSLSIPIKKATSNKVNFDNVEISYDTNWQRLHFKSIESAYRSSAFYEYYIDAFMPFFSNKYQYLLEFNTEILKVLLNELELDVNFEFTTHYYTSEFATEDFRYKKGFEQSTSDSKFKPYYQIFNEKFNFQANLSILDLLFNEGPNSISFLK